MKKTNRKRPTYKVSVYRQVAVHWTTLDKRKKTKELGDLDSF